MKSKYFLGFLCLLIFVGCDSDSLITQRLIPDESNGSIAHPQDILGPTTDFPKIKLVVDRAGVYQVSQEEIEELTNGRGYLHKAGLYHRGQAYPMWIETSQNHTWLRFYAPEPDSRYTNSAIYWISFSDYPSPTEKIQFLQEADPDSQQMQVTIVTSFEEDNLYEPSSPEQLPWFWKKIPIGDHFEFDIQLAPNLIGQGVLQIRLWTRTPGQLSPSGGFPHAVELLLNNDRIGEYQWTGSGFKEIRVRLDPGKIEGHPMKLEVRSNSLASDANDVVWLDGFSLESDSVLKPANSPAYFFGQNGNTRINLEPESTVIAVESGRLIHVYKTTTSSQAVILPMQENLLYFLMTENNVRAPDSMKVIAATEIVLHQDRLPDYLILGFAEFDEVSIPLMEWRAAHGFQPAYINIDQVVDKFGNGYPEPAAIRDFLADIYARMLGRKFYVLLLGDFSHSRVSVHADQPLNFIPSEFVYTDLGGWTISDTALVDFDNNGSPDLPIGRLPVNNKSQAKVIIQKIIDYESDIQNKPVELLPIVDPSAPIFFDQAKIIADEFSSNQNESIRVLTQVSTQQSLLETYKTPNINLLFYFGHGSLSQLGDPAIFSRETNIATRRSGIFIGFTCLVGYFAHPDQVSLVEHYLLMEQGGFVAALVPTSLTLAENQKDLVRSITGSLLYDHDSRLGDLLVTSLAHAWQESPKDLDTLRTFLLIGDPATSIFGNLK